MTDSEINEIPSPEELNKNQDVYNSIVSNIGKIESTLSEIDGRIKELTGKRQSLFTQAEKLQDDLKQKMMEIETIQKDKAEKDNQITSIIAEKEELKAENDRLGRVTGESGEQVTTLANQIKEKDIIISQLEQEKSGIENKRQQLEKSTQIDFENLSKLSQKIIDINTSIESNNKQLKNILSESWNLETSTGPSPSSSSSELSNSGVEVPVPVGEDEENLVNDELLNEAIEEKNVQEPLDVSESEPVESSKTPSYADIARGNQLGGKKRLPLLYGGTKVPVWRRKKSATSIFRKYKRSQLNRMASKWGVVLPLKYKRKKDLAISMRLLMHYRYGDLKLKSDIEKVARIVGINKNHYKTKSSLKRAINKKMINMKMKAGSYFASELKSGLLKKIRTPLLKGGQGKFLTMRKSSYIRGGGSQGNFLMKGGGYIKVLKFQNKRKNLENTLDKTKRAKDRLPIQKKIRIINEKVKSIMKKGGCGCTTRGGSANIGDSIVMGYHHDHPRSKNHTLGGKRRTKKHLKKKTKK